MSENRDAAAVLLVRGTGTDLEVCLVERAPELRFFGGYLALPGGVRSEVDATLAGVGPNEPGAGRGDDAELRWCAVRELFEETGVLLLAANAANADPARRRALREALLRGETAPWRAFAQDARLRPDLRDVCRIRTPPFAPVRYDTLFVLADLPAGEQPDVWPGELTGGRFWRPADALAAWRRGLVLIVPPVLILLEALVGRDGDGFAAAAGAIADSYRAGRLHRVRFSPGIVMASVATPTLPPATTTNCLIVGEERLYVVDPGTPDRAEQDRLCALLAEMRGEGRVVAGVLLTHQHADHSGGAAAMSARFDLEVRAHATTLACLPAGLRLGPPIGDGERIALGTAPDGSAGWHLEAVFTPGHARGHLSFAESRYGALIAGDMISTVSTIVIDPPEGHMRTYLQSLERLRALPMTTLYPAHGPAVRDGQRVVEHYLSHRAQRQRRLAEALGRGPATVEQLLPVVYDDTDVRMYRWAARSLLAGLQMLEEEGRAAERDGVWSAAG